MSFLRFVSLVALAIWIGGLAALGGVGAPAVFDVLQQVDPVGGRETAGLVFGTIFERFQHVAWALAAVLLGVLGARAALGPRPRRFGWRMWTIIAMLAISLTTSFYITPRIETIRRAIQGPVAGLADDDARKIEFGRLHGASNGLMLLTMFGGIWLIWMERRE